MELLDRYLSAVRFLLPKSQQDDIIAELRDDLYQQIEDRQSQLGRNLTEDELAAILKERGQPMLVAARYAPQGHLIGPVLLPIYMFVLKLVILWVMLPIFAFIVGPIVVFTSPNPSVGLLKAIWDLVTGAVFTLGLITLIFAILERFPDQLNKWDPRKLPKVPVMPVMPNLAAAKLSFVPQPTSPLTAITELVSGVISCALWTYILWFHPDLSFGASPVEVTLTPIWHTMFWPILLVFLSGVPLGLVTLLRPADKQLRSIMRLTIQAFSLVVTCVLLGMGPWVDLASQTVSPASLAEAVKWTNLGVQIGIGVVGIITIIDMAQEAFRLFRGRAIRASRLMA